MQNVIRTTKLFAGRSPFVTIQDKPEMRDLDIKRIELQSQLVPRMPPGLPEMMQGLTKEVLLHNPENIYEFCAEYMKKLLKIRDQENARRSLTLDEKIKIAQRKVRENLKKRAHEYEALISKFIHSEQHTVNNDPGEMNKNELMAKISEPDKTLIENHLETEELSNSAANYVQEVVELKNLEDVKTNDAKNSIDSEIEQRTKEDQKSHDDNSDPCEAENSVVDNYMKCVAKQETSPKTEGNEQVFINTNESLSIQDSKITTSLDNIKDTSVKIIDNSENSHLSAEESNIIGIGSETIKTENDMMDTSANMIDNLENSHLSAEESNIIEMVSDTIKTENDNTSANNIDNLENSHLTAEESNIIEMVSDTIKTENENTSANNIDNLENSHLSAEESSIIGVVSKNIKTENIETTCDSNNSDHIDVQNVVEVDMLSVSNEITLLSKNVGSEIMENHENTSEIDSHGKLLDTSPLHNIVQTDNISVSQVTSIHEAQNSDEIVAYKDTEADQNVAIDTNVVFGTGIDVNMVSGDDIHGQDLLKIENNNEHDTSAITTCDKEDFIEITDLVKLETLKQVEEIFTNANTTPHLVEAVNNGVDKSPESSNKTDVIEINGSKREHVEHVDALDSKRESIMDIAAAAKTIQKHFRTYLNKKRDSILVEPMKDVVESEKTTVFMQNRNTSSEKQENLLKSSKKNSMDLDTAASTLQKHFRSFRLRKGRNDSIDSQCPSKVNKDTVTQNNIENSELQLSNKDQNMLEATEKETMDLETAAVTIQKHFRTFMFKNKNSLSEEHVQKSVSEDGDDETDLENFAVKANEGRKLGLMRMDTILQTVNEEKSLSLSTDDSSTLSSAATIIQARVRGFLTRNKLNAMKIASSDSKHSDDLAYKSLEKIEDRPKTILNIQLIQDMDMSFNRDESIGASLDLPMDDSPPPMNLHPLGYDRNEPGKRLKRENAIQSVSPPSNNSGKQSEETDSAKEMFVNSELVTKLDAQNIEKVEKDIEEITQVSIIKNDTMCSDDSEHISDSQNKKLLLENESADNSVSSCNDPKEKNDVGNEKNVSDCKVEDDVSNSELKLCSEKFISNEKLTVTAEYLGFSNNIESDSTGKMVKQESEDKTETSFFDTPKADSAENSTMNKPLSKQCFDTADVVTANMGLMHSSEFHDALLPTRVIRQDSSVLREFKSVLGLFMIWK